MSAYNRALDIVQHAHGTHAWQDAPHHKAVKSQTCTQQWVGCNTYQQHTPRITSKNSTARLNPSCRHTGLSKAPTRRGMLALAAAQTLTKTCRAIAGPAPVCTPSTQASWLLHYHFIGAHRWEVQAAGHPHARPHIQQHPTFQKVRCGRMENCGQLSLSCA